jgi:hypothetical protein
VSTSAITKPDSQQFETLLAKLKAEAESIAVNDAATCLAAKTGQRDVRNYMKDVHLKLDPFVEAAKRNLQTARDELNRWLDPAEEIDSTLALKVKDYERREREAAEAEQRRVNEERRRIAQELAAKEREERERAAELERRKREIEIREAQKAGEVGKREGEKLKREAAAELERQKDAAARQERIDAANVPEVTVKPAIPSVAGVPSRLNWRFKIVDIKKIPQQYWIIDEQEIGAAVRRIKSKEQAERQITGIEVWQE